MGKSLEVMALDEADGEAPKTSPTRLRAANALRVSGASYQQVADIENFDSATSARRAVEAGLAAQVDSEDIKAQRALANARLDRLLSSLWTKALDTKNPDQIAYNRAAQSIVDRMAKLNGLDAPQKVEVYTPDAAERAAWIEKVMAELQDESEAEADIIDAEIVDE